MRILYLTQFFDPEPMPKGLSFAKALAAEGHEVRVLTGFPNYPGGIVYKGYKLRPWQHETIDGIRITRVALYPSHSRSKLGRILNYTSFMASATLAGLFSGWRPDVLYVYHPPLTVGIAASIIGALRGVPFVYDILDLWPDTLRATRMLGNDRLLRLIGRMANAVYRRAAQIVVQPPGYQKALIARGVPAGKITCIPSWCDEELLAKRPAIAWHRPVELMNKFLLTFAGNMGPAQGLDAVLDAMKIVATRQPNARLLCIGGGTDAQRLAQRSQAEAIGNVCFLPSLPMHEIGSVLDASDALLVHLHDDPLFAITIPSKTQAYLFAGKPVLMAVAGDAADLILESGGGITAPPEQPNALAEAILKLAALSDAERHTMGQRGRAYYDAKLALPVGIRATVAALEAAALRR